MLCRKSVCTDDSGSVPVYLNVYDLTPYNGYAYWLGLGVYHSGVQGWYYLAYPHILVCNLSWFFKVALKILRL